MIDLSEIVFSDTREDGVHGIALHPDYPGDARIFVSFAFSEEGQTYYRISSFEISGLQASLESEIEIYRQSQRVPVHAMNHIEFDRSGMLLIALGDNAVSPSPAQDLDDPRGSLLRIDVDQTEDSRNYAIPADNPFPDAGSPEIYAYGLRNVWRFSVDDDGNIWAGDVGEDSYEEVNRIVAGGNYGWPITEGEDCFRGEPCELPADFVRPVWTYGRSQGRSITGGIVYQGSAMPELQGRYVFGDFGTGAVFALERDVGDVADSAASLVSGGAPLVSFFSDSEGELYVLGWGEDIEIYRLQPNETPSDSFPRRLSETGCVEVADPRRVIDEVQPYEVISPLWSDGAEKRRFFSVPEGTEITIDDDGRFVFPVGSVLIKEFAFEGRPHETRLFMHHRDGWGAYSYRWNEAGTDAELVSGRLSERLDNGVQWAYPSRSDCFECHTDTENGHLGLELSQLAADSEFFSDRFFSEENLERAQAAARLVDPSGTEAVELRARAYLHSNCSGCHQGTGFADRATIDLRYDTALEDTGTCNEASVVGRPWAARHLGEMQIVSAGDPETSILYFRMTTNAQSRMPPLGSGVVDTEGAELIREWIETTTCP